MTNLTNIKNQRAINLISVFIPATVVVYYFFFIAAYSINFPFFDDFDAVLDFIQRNLTNHGTAERARLFFAQHNEHRLTFARIIIWLQYWLFGEVNFRLLILFGNLSLILAILYLYKSFVKSNQLHIVYLLPVSLLLFTFRFEEVSFMATASLQFPWVICFALLSLYFLFHNNRYAIILAVAFATIATFTSANGMMVFVAGALVLLLNKETGRKQKLIWLISGILMIFLYFLGYEKPGYHPSVIQPLLHDPLGFIGYILAFLGSAVGNLAMAILIGAGLALFILFITIKKYYRDNPVIFALVVFILITAVTAALTRFGFGMEQAVSSRYSIYSCLLIICCYMTFLSVFSRKMNLRYLSGFVILALAFNGVTQAYYVPKIIGEKREFEANYALLKEGKPSQFHYGWPMPDGSINDYGLKYLQVSDSLGYFRFNIK